MADTILPLSIHERRAHTAQLLAYLESRITSTVEHGELDRYHREDCLAIELQRRVGAPQLPGTLSLPLSTDDCDCDAADLIEQPLRAILAAALRIGRLRDARGDLTTAHYGLLLQLAQPWAERVDFPRP